MRQFGQFKRIPAALAACVLLATTLVVVIAQPGPASAAPDELSGRVFNDLNNNGVDDAEPPVAGVTVTAYNAAGAISGSATTNALGLYTITGLTPGENYRVEFTTLPAGWTEGPIGPDSDTSVAFAAPETTDLNFGTHEPVLCDEQVPSDALLLTYNAAVSCSAVVDPAYPKDAFGIIDITNSVPASGRQDVTSSTPVFHHPDWHIDQLGNIFGVAVDTRRGDFFGAASSNYSHEFYSNTGTGNVPAIVQYGNIGGGAQDLAAAGTVYQMDAVTGAPSVFVQLPQQSTSVVHQDCETNTTVSRTTGVGLGNIVYDSTNDQMFAANWEDGHIYRIDMNGNILDAYDPDATDDGTPGFANGQVPYALELSDDGTRLYWGTVFGLEVWSIDLTATGGFTGTTSTSGGTTIYENAASETLNQTIVIPTAGEPDPTWLNNNLIHFVSDLELLPNGDMMAGLRVGCNASPHGAYNHQGQTHTLTDGGAGIFSGNAGPLDVSATGDAGLDDNYGGVAYSELADGSIEYAVTSADILDEDGPHGLAVFEDGDASAAPITPLGAIDYGTPNDPKGIAGDVEILNIYECTPTPIEIGNYVWLDLDQDGIQDPDELPLAGVTVTLYAADGVTVLATTTTDANGQYVFTEIDGVFPNTSYEVGFDVSTTTTALPGGASPSDLSETTPDATGGATGGAGDDFRDSDVVGGRIAVTTGDPGDNDHTLDAGYTLDYDLALTKVYTSDDFEGTTDGVIAVGSNVTFTVTVINQGFFDAETFTVTDYIPAGFSLNDGAWTDNGDGTASYTGGPLIAGDDVDIPITLTADSATSGDHVNWAEISADDGDDADSTPNSDPDDDSQPAGPGDPTDNEIDNASGDEDDHDPAGVTVGGTYDLALIKVYTSDNVGNPADGVIATGADVTFTITVENQGTIDATTFTVTDYIPAGFVLNDPAWSDNGDGTANFVGGPLAAGDDVDIPITLTAVSAVDGEHVNWAEISADDGDDADSTPNSDPDDDSQPAGPGDPTDNEIDNASGDEDDHDPAGVTLASFDLALTKVFVSDTSADGNAADGVVGLGDDVTFAVTVINQGTVDATSFSIIDYVPAGFVLNDSDWLDNGDGTASYTGGILAAGASISVEITMTAVSAAFGDAANWAEISSDSGDDVDSTPNTDPNDDNQPDAAGDPTDDEVDNGPDADGDPDEDDHDVAAVTVVPEFDLALRKTVSASTNQPVVPGQKVTFDITIFNQGSTHATDISIVDYLGAGWAAFDLADNPAGLTSGDQSLPYSWAGGATPIATVIGSLAPGEQVTVPVTVSIPVSKSQTPLSNTAEIATATPTSPDGTPIPDLDDVDSTPDQTNSEDPVNDVIDNTGNDEDDHDIETVTPAIFDLALRKRFANGANSATVRAGDLITFELTVFNQGNVDATDISLVDYPPSGLTLSDPDWSTNAAGNPIISLSGVVLKPGESTSVDITFRVGSSVSGQVSNQAEITGATPVDVDGTVLLQADGTQLLDIDSVADAVDSETPVDDEIGNANGDEDDHDVAVLSVTRQSTFIAFTGVSSGLIFLSGLLIMLAGSGMTLLVRDRRRGAEVRV